MHTFFPCRSKIAFSSDQIFIIGMADDIHLYICETSTHVNLWYIMVSKNYIIKVIL